jgi:hypothetical protein
MIIDIPMHAHCEVLEPPKVQNDRRGPDGEPYEPLPWRSIWCRCKEEVVEDVTGH